jgi:hypothetical protein
VSSYQRGFPMPDVTVPAGDANCKMQAIDSDRSDSNKRRQNQDLNVRYGVTTGKYRSMAHVG